MARLMESDHEFAGAVDVAVEGTSLDANVVSQEMPVADTESNKAINSDGKLVPVLTASHDVRAVCDAVSDLDERLVVLDDFFAAKVGSRVWFRQCMYRAVASLWALARWVLQSLHEDLNCPFHRGSQSEQCAVTDSRTF